MRIKDLGKCITGRTPSSKNPTFYGGEIPFIRIPDLGDGRFIGTVEKTLTAEGLEVVHKAALPKGSVMVSCIATIGKVGITRESVSVTNQQINSIIPNEEIVDTEWLYYFFKDLGEDLAVFGGGGSVFEIISKSKFQDIEIDLPNRSTQETIADVLSSLDDKIDLLKRQNKTLEGMAEALFRQWFIEEAQDEWPEVQFQEIVKVSRGVSYSGKLLGDDGIPMHNLKSASVGGGYRYDGIKFFQGDVKSEKILSPGEILMVNTDMTPDNRIIGQPIRVPSFYPKSICSHHMYHLGFECSATQTFVYQYFRIEENRELLANYSNGTTVSMLGSKVLKTVEIPLPPIKLRETFMEYRRDIDDKLDSNEMKIRNLTAQRDTLLPKLMSGEVRVQMAS
jgi:type I restriction enzyme S subunit